jgi:hypothetical protein
MPSDKELSADRGAKEDIAVGEFSLAGGAVSLILMKHWELRREDFNIAYFGIPELDGAALTVRVDVVENPAAIAANDLLDYLILPDFPPLPGDAIDRIRDSNGEPDFEKLTVRYRGPSELAENESQGLRGPRMSRIWRRLGLRRPNLVRSWTSRCRSMKRMTAAGRRGNSRTSSMSC